MVRRNNDEIFSAVNHNLDKSIKEMEKTQHLNEKRSN